jgi:hypothetical protein
LLEQVFEDGPEHQTACLHPLEVGEDMSLSTPQIEDSEIVAETDPSPEKVRGDTS